MRTKLALQDGDPVQIDLPDFLLAKALTRKLMMMFCFNAIGSILHSHYFPSRLNLIDQTDT